MTEKFFEQNVYARTCSAHVVSAEIVYSPGKGKKPAADYIMLELDRTVFFPEGGGQSCDRGYIDSYPVVDVQEKGGVIIHKLLVAGKDSPTGTSYGPADACDYFDGAAVESVFAQDNTVICEIDWGHRFANMQRHCGEHILSGTFFRLFGGINHGFHMGDDYMTIDIGLDTEPGGDVPGEEGSAPAFSANHDMRWQGSAEGAPGTSARDGASHIGGEMTADMLREAEDCANRIIRADLPVHTDRFSTHDEAMAFPLRKEMKIRSDISVVTIGSREKPADCCACCGTHPRSSGAVGLLKIYKTEKNGDWWRIYFDAGAYAMKEYDRIYDIVADISDRFTTGSDKVLDSLDAYMRHSDETHARLMRILKSETERRADNIITALKGGAGAAEHCTGQLPTWHYDDLEVDDMLRIGHDVQERLGIDTKGKKAGGGSDAQLLDKPLCLVEDRGHIVLLFSNGSTDCGKLVKENAGIYGGRGGGSKVSARAIFSDSVSADTYLDLIEKHLR
ncbi:MAG: alanyl-tRNA editing protein [Eubacteriaceae bacterium]|jgi:alanyl-tRNA synthetase|nr:alanyl-tRNA editing protein [Eubacteriaceae bacterium]